MKRTPPIDIMNSPDWDAMWRDAEIPDGRNDEWREVMAYRTKLPDDAIRLASHAWTPELVVAARENPYIYYTADVGGPNIHQHYPEGADVPTSTAAKLVLADETAKWHENRMQLARELRWMQIRDLAAHPRWTHQMIGDLIGLTKQRIQAIVKSKSITDAWKG